MGFSFIEIIQIKMNNFLYNGMTSLISVNEAVEPEPVKTQSDKIEDLYVALDEMSASKAKYLTEQSLRTDLTKEERDDLGEQSNALRRQALDNSQLFKKTNDYFDPKHPTQKCVWL